MKQLTRKNLKSPIIVRQAVFDRDDFGNIERWTKSVRPLIGLFFLISLNLACQPNQSILNSGQPGNSASAANTVERPKETFESALGGVRRSGFSYIFVMRRKDGEKFTRDDKAYVRENSPAATNQFILTDEERAVIAGSNYQFPPENLELLRKAFNVEDLSPPKEANVNGSANLQNNANSNSDTNTASE